MLKIKPPKKSSEWLQLFEFFAGGFAYCHYASTFYLQTDTAWVAVPEMRLEDVLFQTWIIFRKPNLSRSYGWWKSSDVSRKQTYGIY